MGKQSYRVVDEATFERAVAVNGELDIRHLPRTAVHGIMIYFDDQCREIGRKLTVFETERNEREVTHYLRADLDLEPVLGPLFV